MLNMRQYHAIAPKESLDLNSLKLPYCYNSKSFKPPKTKNKTTQKASKENRKKEDLQFFKLF